MPKPIVSILKREFIDFVISTYNKHGLTTEKMSMLRDFFYEPSHDKVAEIRAKLMIEGSDLPEQMSNAFGIKNLTDERKLNLAASLSAMNTPDSAREVLMGKIVNLYLTTMEIHNNNTYLSIDPNADIGSSRDSSLFKQADISDINNRIKLLLTKDPNLSFIDVPLSRKEDGIFKGDLNLSMFDLKNVQKTIADSKKVFPEDFVGRKVLEDISEYLDKNYPPHVKQKG
jgi:hypothetical protein